MRRLFAIVLAVLLWFGFVETAPAQALYDNLTPCGQSKAFETLMKSSESPTAMRRYEQYSKAGLLCGPEGLPHLIVDNPAYAGQFIIPGLMFLYITGWIGWVGRSYLQAIQKGANPEAKEITIDVPLAIKSMLSGFSWPLAAFGELTSGKLVAKEGEITVSPR